MVWACPDVILTLMKSTGVNNVLSISKRFTPDFTLGLGGEHITVFSLYFVSHLKTDHLPFSSYDVRLSFTLASK